MEKVEKIQNPLPRRFEKVSEKRKSLEQGIVLQPTDGEEYYDITNAAQSIVIEPVLTEVQRIWESPELNLTQDNFYRCFGLFYYDLVQKTEEIAWSTIVDGVYKNPPTDLNNLTSLEAAVMTLYPLGYEKVVVSSGEVFAELAMHAEQYTLLLQEEYGDVYTCEILYKNLRAHFPVFLKRMIALDPVIIDLYRLNAPEQDRTDTEKVVRYPGAQLDSRFYTLSDDDVFKIKPALIEALKKQAQENDLHEDRAGRTYNRGCPFLLANDHDQYIDFAIEEFIAQHKKVFVS